MTLIKKYGSYLIPLGVEKRSSSVNPLIEVNWENGVKVLNSKRANYSFGSLHQVFKKAFREFNIPITAQSKVLILGFGGGSIYSILRNDLKFEGHITGIELDPEIIKVAKTHFDVPENNSKFDLINIEAEEFINTTSKKFDLITIDIFDDLFVPENFLTAKFINPLYQRLNNKGIILFNVIDQQQQLILLKNAITQCKLTYQSLKLTKNESTNYILKIKRNKN